MEQATPSPDFQKVIGLAVYAGELLLRSGAETSRVEQTMDILLRSFGIRSGSSLVIPTGIYVSVGGLSGEQSATLMRRIPTGGRSLNLNKLVAVNELSRKAVLGKITLEQVENELHSIANARDLYAGWLRITAGAASAAGATLLLGGDGLEGLIAFAGSFLVQLILRLFEKRQIPGVFGDFSGAALATAFALLLIPLSVQVSTTRAIAGSILVLVPGAALLASVGDGIAGDLLSSAARGLEAFLKGASIAAGVGFSLGLAISLGVPARLQEKQGEIWQMPVQVVAAFGCAAFFAIGTQAPRKVIGPVGLSGAICWLFYLLLKQSSANELLAIFVAAFGLGMLAWALARRQFMPVTVYVLPGIVPLLPGLTIYKGMYALSQNQNIEGFLLLAQALFTCFALAAAVGLSNTLFPRLWPTPHSKMGSDF